MIENQLPVHYTSAEETGRVRPAVDSGDGGAHLYLVDDLSNSVQITMAHFSADGSASAASAVAVAPLALSGPRNQYVAYAPERHTKLEEARDPIGTWLRDSAVISLISLTILYTIYNPQWVSSFVAQTVKIKMQMSADIKRRPSTPLGGTAVTDTGKAGAETVAGAAGIHGAPTGRSSACAVQPKGETAIYGVTRNSVVVRSTAPTSLGDVDRSAAHYHGSSSGAHRTLASNREETGTRKNSPRHTHNGNHTAKSRDLLVPPPPPTPCVLPPEFGFFQPAQQYAAPQQVLQQAQAQAFPKTHNQSAARESAPQQPTAASGKTEATQSAVLVDADQELQAALSSSLRTVGEWTR